MSLEDVRRKTDRHVLDALIDAGLLTRAEIAAAAGVSKPTASQSVSRLADLGLIEEAGRAVGGRGRTGTYCRIPDDAALALAVHSGPGEVLGECVDPAGRRRAQVRVPVGTTITATRLRTVLIDVIEGLEAQVGAAVPNRAISVADPVDADGRLVHMPDPPFVTGECDLADLAGPGGVVDNDVNWAACAELAGGDAPEAFLYVFLGVGMGAACVDGGRVVRGRGVAGEISHVLTVDRAGRAAPLVSVLAALGLCRDAETSLDVEAVTEALRTDPADIITALAGAIASSVAILDPAALIVGGPWGSAALHTGLRDALDARVHRVVPVRPASVPDAWLVGVRAHAATLARADLHAAAAGPPPAPAG